MATMIANKRNPDSTVQNIWVATRRKLVWLKDFEGRTAKKTLDLLLDQAMRASGLSDEEIAEIAASGSTR